MRQFLAGNASPLTEHAPPPPTSWALPLRFYAAGIPRAGGDAYQQMVEGDIVWVGTAEDVIERIEAVKEVCEACRGLDHGQSGCSPTGRRSRPRSCSPTS